MEKTKDLHERLNEIKEIRIEKPQTANEQLLELLKDAEKLIDSDIMAEIYCYLADTYFRLRVVHKGIPAGLKALMFTRASNESSTLLPMIYNLIGVGYSSMGECGVAQEYYLKGLKYATRYSNVDMEVLLKINIGSLFLQLGDYVEGQKYIGNAYKISHRLTDEKSQSMRTLREREHAEELLDISLLNMADVYYHRGEYDAALKYLKRLSTRKMESASDFFDPNIVTLSIKSHFKLGHRHEADELLFQLLDTVPKAENIELFADYIEIVRILMELGDFEKAEKVINLVREVCMSLDSIPRWMDLYSILIEYYKVREDMDNYYETCVKYFETSNKNTEYYNKTVLSAIKNQIEIEQNAEREKERTARSEELKLLSETDELTGLLNRRSFNNLSQRYYQDAHLRQKPFTLIVLDIDCFKQYNDAYGHIAGDECLRALGKILKDRTNENLRIARYGGDEFVVMARYQSKKEIEEFVKTLQKDVEECNIKHEYSTVIPRVSISIGIASVIPIEEGSVMDLFQQADDALYKAKSNGKNRYEFYD